MKRFGNRVFESRADFCQGWQIISFFLDRRFFFVDLLVSHCVLERCLGPAEAVIWEAVVSE
jgi:hypothetical protein